MSFYRAEEAKGGLNLYIGSKRVANKLGKALEDEFNAQIKKSYKLHSRSGGEDIYRNIILARF